MGAPAQFLFKPGERPVGRAAGTPNKLTSYLRSVIAGAFDKVGGEEAFYEWAKLHPTHFYTKIWVKLLPDSSQLSDDEREKVLDAMLGVTKVLTREFTAESAETTPTLEIDAKSQPVQEVDNKTALQEPSGPTISTPSDPNHSA